MDLEKEELGWCNYNIYYSFSWSWTSCLFFVFYAIRKLRQKFRSLAIQELTLSVGIGVDLGIGFIDGLFVCEGLGSFDGFGE